MIPLVIYLKDVPSEGEEINEHIFNNEWKQMYEDYVGETPEYQKVYDFVEENLQTHDTKRLCKAISKKYENIKFATLETKNVSKYTLYCFGNDDELNNLINDNDLLCFFNYFYTRERIIKGVRHILLEPLYTEDASKIVTESHHKLYHFSPKEQTEKTLKVGLRCKGRDLSKNEYRNFPSRIYCLAIPHKFKSEKFNQVINKFIEETGFISKNYDLLEINLNGQKRDSWHQKFYKDEYMTLENAVFTYHNIPAKYIRKVNYAL